MSLKVVHIFFIAASVLMSFGFGVWGIYIFTAGDTVWYLVMGIGSTLIGVVLVIYGINFVQKFRHVRNL